MSIINRDTVRKPHRMPTNPKPVLEVAQLPVFRVHHTKLEAYVEQVFGFEFDFLLAAGVTEGQCVDVDVTGALPSSEWERRAADLRAGRRTKAVVLILAVLCKDGYIKPGRYTISTHPLPDPTAIYTQLLYQTQDPDSAACRQFRERHRGDETFVQRAAILDTRVREIKATT